MAVIRTKKPFVPPARDETVRHRLAEVLRERELTAKELSREVGVPEKEILEHLAHMSRTYGGQRLRLVPPTCRKCGFVFAKRERLNSPGKCPVCRGEHIDDPKFHLG